MIEVRRLRDPFAALGLALHFVAQRDPFGKIRSNELVFTIDGQIRRNHYLLAFDRSKVMGYVGWALLSESDAEALAKTLVPPTTNLLDGDVVWALTAAAKSREALNELLRAGRKLNLGRRVIGLRHRANGKITLLRSRA